MFFFFEKWVSRGTNKKKNLMLSSTSVARWIPSYIKPHYLIISADWVGSSFDRSFEKFSIPLHDLLAYGGWVDFQCK